MVKASVADRVLFLLTQLFADDAFDLARVLEDLVEAAIVVDPLDRSFLTDLVNADEIVAALADQGGDIRILVGLDTIALHHRVAVVALEFGYAPGIGIKQRNVVVHQLNGIPVTTDNEHAVSVSLAAGCECGEDVVGLVVLFADGGDVHGCQGFFEKWNLPDELRRGVAAGSLVLCVLAGAKRVAGDVECDGQMGRLLFLQQQDEHRNETVNGVCMLAFAVDKTVQRKRVKRPERQRMAVDDQEGRLFVVRHPASLSAAGDSLTESSR